MDRINGADFVDLGGGKRGFRDEDLPTGTPGTVVTADFLNSTQEELIGIIEASGLVPSAADRAQLAKAIQSGRLNYVVGGGTANAITGTLTPAPAAYTIGMPITLKVALANTGPATINLNGLGVKNIVASDGSPLVANDLGGFVSLVYNGTAFVLDTLIAATETTRGVVQLATAAETVAGASLSKPASVARMAAAVQAGSWSVANAVGSVNAYTANLVPAPAAYTWGMIISLWFGTANTGASTLNLNGLGPVPIINGDGSAVLATDLSGNVTLICAGAAFLVLSTRPAKETGRGVVQLADAATTKAGTDLNKPAAVARMATAVQAGSWNFAIAGGTANALTASLTPAPAALTAGMQVNLQLTAANTGAVTLNVNGIGAVAVTNADGTQVQNGQLTGGIYTFTYTGTAWAISNFRNASETWPGISELASASETTAGTDMTRPASVGRMATGVQSGRWNFAVAGGTANALTASLTPAPTAYNSGMVVNLNVTTPNTGPATLNVNGLGPISIINNDGTPLVANDLAGVVSLIHANGVFVVSNILTATEANRGVVELASAAETTAGSDLTRPASVGRMAPAVQAGSWSYAVAGGTANALTAILSPAPSALTVGMQIELMISATNSGAATLNTNGLGAVAIQTRTGAALKIGDMPAGAIIPLIYNGTAWRLACIAYSEVPIISSTNVTLYVRTDGNDSNDGSANTAAKAFATVAGAIAFGASRYLVVGGATLIIQLGLAGTYAAPPTITVPQLTIQGDIANQGSYIISGAGPGAGSTGVIAVASGCSLLFRGLTQNNTSSINHNFAVAGTGSIYIEYTTILTAVLTTFALAFAGGSGSITLGTGNIWQASAGYMLLADGGSISIALSQTLASTPNFTVATLVAIDGGKILRGSTSVAFLGTGAFGTRYSATLNGVINMLFGGASFIPGNAAGTTATGGQYQ